MASSHPLHLHLLVHSIHLGYTSLSRLTMKQEHVKKEPSESCPGLSRHTRGPLPLDIILNIASYSAGSFDFKTLLNVALTNKNVHQAVKPTLKEPIVVWDAERSPDRPFLDACRIGFPDNARGMIPREWRKVR
jgi:hypothetical protein